MFRDVSELILAVREIFASPYSPVIHTKINHFVLQASFYVTQLCNNSTYIKIIICLNCVQVLREKRKVRSILFYYELYNCFAS